MLLGGDLFNDNKPTPSTLNKATSLLNKYCLGSGDINFTHHPTEKSPLVVLFLLFIPLTTRPVNYEDENLNIALPVFVIHGNHDDPTHEVSSCNILSLSQGPESKAHSALDILSSSRLVNYFACVPESFSSPSLPQCSKHRNHADPPLQGIHPPSFVWHGLRARRAIIPHVRKEAGHLLRAAQLTRLVSPLPDPPKPRIARHATHFPTGFAAELSRSRDLGPRTRMQNRSGAQYTARWLLIQHRFIEVLHTAARIVLCDVPYRS